MIYTLDELKHLRCSPLVVKPPGLPPMEQWMGSTKLSIQKTKINDSNVLSDQINRRLIADKQIQRNNHNPEDIILGPPKTSFMSATSTRNTSKHQDSQDRVTTRESGFNFRMKTSNGEHDRGRDSRNNILRSRRTESDQDTEVWNSGQPRKSFGNEGAERLSSRMGGEKAPKDREDYDRKERPRGFDSFSRDRTRDQEQDRERNHRSHGIGRGRTEPSWFKERDNHDLSVNSKDRYNNGEKHAERNRGWRNKEKDERAEKGSERYADRSGTRDERGDRIWDRRKDQYHEHDPEWMDDPIDEKSQPRTTADFEKWKEQMQGRDRAANKALAENMKTELEQTSSAEMPKVEAPLEFTPGPDKFLTMFTPKEENFSDSVSDSQNEGARKPKAAGKASRFTSFFTAQDEPSKAVIDTTSTTQPLSSGNNESSSNNNSQSNAEKEAFQQLLQKLQRQSLHASGSNPPSASLQTKISASEKVPTNIASPPDPYQIYQNDRQDEARPSPRHSQGGIQDLYTHRQMAESQNAIRPEQMLQELVGQRQNVLNQPNIRINQLPRNTTPEYSMGLMQISQSAPDPQRLEQLLRMPPKSDNRQMQQHIVMEREHELQREAAERNVSDRQSRPQPPPGFFDESAYSRGPILPHERQSRNAQPTQILQRPPGLDMGWDRQGQQLPPPQHRIAQNIAPPPGLASNLNRAMPIPQQIFPPGFPAGNFPPPDVMSVPPRNLQMQPPPGFFNGPPGFITPGMGGGFQGPEGMAYGAPYDGRGPPSQGAFRR